MIFKNIRWRILAMSALAAFWGAAASAEAGGKTIRIGVLGDMSGVYADYQGPGSVISAQMAVEDFGGQAAGKPIEVISGDHQNKPDVGLGFARRWLTSEDVDVIVDVPNSAIALGVSDIVLQYNKVMIASGAGTTELTGKKCSPNTVQWTYDNWAQGHGIARALMQRGFKRWFFITSDYAFGHDLERNAAEEVVKLGGTVLGAARHPLGATDFSSFLLQAQASGADIVAFANAGGDFATSAKQAAEFQLSPRQTLTGLILNTTSVPAMGIQTAQGLYALNAFYWDTDEPKRAWAKRWAERHPQHNFPNDMHAGVYSGVLHYLKSAAKTGSVADGKAVVDAMKKMPFEDILFGKGTVREDGRTLHPMYLYQVKSPAESKSKWDVYKLVSTIPAEEAFRPLAEGNCPFVK